MSKRSQYLGTMSTGFEELGQGGRPGSVCGAYGCIQACHGYLKGIGRVSKARKLEQTKGEQGNAEQE